MTLTFYTQYDLVNILTGKLRTVSHDEMVEYVGEPEWAECVYNGWYGDCVVAPSEDAEPFESDYFPD